MRIEAWRPLPGEMCRLTLETDTPAAEILAALVNQTALAKGNASRPSSQSSTLVALPRRRCRSRTPQRRPARMYGGAFFRLGSGSRIAGDVTHCPTRLVAHPDSRPAPNSILAIPIGRARPPVADRPGFGVLRGSDIICGGRRGARMGQYAAQEQPAQEAAGGSSGNPSCIVGARGAQRRARGDRQRRDQSCG